MVTHAPRVTVTWNWVTECVTSHECVAIQMSVNASRLSQNEIPLDQTSRLTSLWVQTGPGVREAFWTSSGLCLKQGFLLESIEFSRMKDK